MQVLEVLINHPFRFFKASHELLATLFKRSILIDSRFYEPAHQERDQVEEAKNNLTKLLNRLSSASEETYLS